jgi:tetratricopeptide (TPR) repeat protein
MKRDILKELLEKSYQAEKQFIASLSEEERNAEGSFETWAAKDILAHIAHWKKHYAGNILSALEGKSPVQIEDGDQANKQVYCQYRDQPWAAIEALMVESCEWMKEALSMLGDEGLERVDLLPQQNELPLWRVVVGNVYTHPIIHLSDWEIKKGSPARAAEMYQEMTGLLSSLDDSPDWQGTIRYNNACSFSLLGEKEKAIRLLSEALEMNPALKEWSQQDPDFEPIRGEAGYKALYE